MSYIAHYVKDDIVSENGSVSGLTSDCYCRGSLVARGGWHPVHSDPGGALALLAAFAMGVDYPGSNRRFSRLAGVD